MHILKPLIALLFFSISTGFQTQNIQLDYKIHWEDKFTKTQKEKVEIWISDVSRVIAEQLGKYPFEIQIHIYERKSNNEPVPWAHTSRGTTQEVHFYIDADYSLDKFQKDWTAPHEIAHLSIPFIGKENMWFSEGYASFMQWHILQKQGLYSKEEINQKYSAKLKMVKSNYDNNNTFLSVSNQMKKNYNYPALYWGGACYFMQVNEALVLNHQTDIFQVIQLYQQKSRLTDDNLEDLIKSLDRVSKTTVFSEYFKLFTTKSARECTAITRITP